ncbi:hypothetical protein fugu_013670 [Takifugu bimaculatus]|uniref:Uncharacterized protein n=1 Tax=Takifugu bimaculatus TaxID=433685 RepID=A0A4Z2C4Z9_9TELE|nr:hypothetical protein fugu_013670 [Takifugu bimaculatus]
MLAEGFLRILLYREERKLASASRRSQSHAKDACNCDFSTADSSDAGPSQEFGAALFQGPKVEPLPPISSAVPVCPHDLSPDANFANIFENCSLLEKYPDLQMIGSEQMSQNPQTGNSNHGFESYIRSQSDSPQLQPQGSPVSLIPDQGYLAMGASVNISPDLPGPEPGLEPMSNSLLNGLLDKQLDEVYMLLLNDNLARCNSTLGNSLLHGLVPPPQPSCQLQGTDSLAPSLEEPPGQDSANKVSYLSTHNVVPCSSNFSTPVLRISEAENTNLK